VASGQDVSKNKLYLDCMQLLLSLCPSLIRLQEVDNKGYACPQCKTSYSLLQVNNLRGEALDALICEICRAEAVENDNAENVVGSSDRIQRFHHQTRFIRAGLQKSEGMVLPAYVAHLLSPLSPLSPLAFAVPTFLPLLDLTLPHG
jgi:hypothetical protein